MQLLKCCINCSSHSVEMHNTHRHTCYCVVYIELYGLDCLLYGMSVLQGDGRTYSYVAALSSDDPPHWDSIFALAKIIPKICHNINR